MLNRVRLARSFAKMFQNGLSLCEPALKFVDRQIFTDLASNIQYFGNATIYLVVDEALVLWPLVFV